MNRSKVIDDFFVCVGAQKAGTTWLARVLSNHPDVFVTPVKEIHYFDHLAGITQHLDDQRRRSRLRKYHQRMWTQPANFTSHIRQWSWYRSYMGRPIDDDWYRGLFVDRLGHRFAGEATPEYAVIGETGYRHLRRLAPNVRLIYILRNPIVQTWSRILHHCRRHSIDASRTGADDLLQMLEASRFAGLGDYMATISALDAVFDRDQVLYLFYEDIHSDRMAGVEKICGHIGLDFYAADFPQLDRRVNRSQSEQLPEQFRLHLSDKLRDDAIGIGQRLGHLPEDWVRDFRL